MHNLNKLRKTFIRQSGRNDCGPACLAMILRYTGRLKECALLSARARQRQYGLSLLELKTMARSFDIPAECVEMEVSFLRGITSPCILHLTGGPGGDHFQVCYGARKKRGRYYYRMADPARHLYELAESSLEQQWEHRAALYFGELCYAPARDLKTPLRSLLSLRLLPGGLCLSVPVLSAFIALMGTALSWVLQRGMESGIAIKAGPVISLLLIITLFRNLSAWLKQHLLVIMGARINDLLIRRLMNRNRVNYPFDEGRLIIRKNLADIQKMQSAVTALIGTLFSEGLQVMVLLFVVFYTLPIAGFINLSYLICYLLISFYRIPKLAFESAHLSELSAAMERSLAELTESNPQPALKSHSVYLDDLRNSTLRWNRINLLFECIGTVNVMSVFTCASFEMQTHGMNYSTILLAVVLSFLITSLMTRVGQALVVIADGADASIQYRSGFSEMP